jgi:Golgi SNAP receptor complex protein 2
MEPLYHQTNRLVQETKRCFVKLENSGDASSDAIEREIQTRIDSITYNCETLEILLHKESLTRRTNVKLRIDQLKYDKLYLQSTLNTYRYRKYRHLQGEGEDEALLNLQFQSSSSQETRILMDHGQIHHTSPQNASRGVDDLSLVSLRDQRLILKSAHRRLYDFANMLGLSNTTVRLIERRVYQNRFILFDVTALTLIVTVLIVFYFT